MRLLGEAATATPSGRTAMENDSKTIKVAMKKMPLSSGLWRPSTPGRGREESEENLVF